MAKPSHTRAVWRVLAIGLLVATGVGFWLLIAEDNGSDQAAATQLIVGPRDGFATSAACRECHEEEHASWHRTFHRTMTQPATPKTLLAPIDDLELASRGRTYRLWRDDEKFWVDMVDPDWEVERIENGEPIPADPPRVKREIVMLTGSHHYQAFWIHGRDGNTLRQVPFVYHLAERVWIPREDAFLHPPSDERVFAVWNATCIQCHSVAGAPGYGETERDVTSRVVELGIACESCHGPGADHVRLMQQPIPPENLAVVNPAKLSKERSADVCGQCHSYFLAKSTRDWWVNGFSRFSAGDVLEESRILVKPQHDHADPNVQYVIERMEGIDNLYWPDGSVRVGGREYLGLIESSCFQKGEMTCLHCHSMHKYREPSDQLTTAQTSNEACLQCHSTYRDRLEEHTHHSADSSGSVCYNCHMPHTSFALFKAIRNHRMTSPRVERQVAKNRPNACNLCHLDQTRQWTAQHLSDWYGQPPMEVEPDSAGVADSVVLALQGDAAQRATIAWAMGWPPAHEASGRRWMAPYLAMLMNDQYSAVRLTAFRSLKNFPEHSKWKYDFLAPPIKRTRNLERLLEKWKESWIAQPDAEAEKTLLNGDGTLNAAIYHRLLQRRDHRPIYISE